VDFKLVSNYKPQGDQGQAIEALTRGLVNKLLHPPMQAIKQAAREGDFAKLDSLCEEWSVSTAEPGVEIERKSKSEIAETVTKKSLEKVS